MNPMIRLLSAELESTTIQETTAIEESTTGNVLEQAGGEIAENLNSAVEEANKFLETLEGYIPKIIEFGINILIAILIFFVGKIIIKYVMKFVNRCFERARMELSVQKFLNSLVRVLLYFVLLIIICNQVGINTTSFIALLSTAGVTIGLALQGSFSNFAGGILILLLKPFKIGDYIVDGSSGKEGVVKRIDLFYTVIITGDNKQITIPNGSLSNTNITNASALDTRRVDLAIGISYEGDMDKAKEVLKAVGTKEPCRLPEQEAFVFIQDYAASEVTIGMRVWVKTEDYWDAYFRMKENMRKALDEAGIEIPYNQLDVHIHQK